MKLYTPLGRTCYFGDSDLMSNLVPITVAHGDGIGPEIMEVCLPKQTVALLGRVLDQVVEIVKTEALRTFNGEVGYTLSQGQ